MATVRAKFRCNSVEQFTPVDVGEGMRVFRFTAVYDDGIDLWFSFGKCRTLGRENVTVRADHGGVVVFPRGAQRFGYPLTDGIVERNRMLLRDVFRFCGFDVVR